MTQEAGDRQAPDPLQPAVDALRAILRAGDLDLEVMGPSRSLWGVTSGTFYAQLQRHFREAGLPPAGIHILRHTAAKLRRDAGESIEDVSRFLDHTSLAVTTTYLRRLASTSSGTPLPSCAEMQVRASRTCPDSWTIRRSR